MKEKELRLALVCYGGVSLAVYMHGITKEVLKLARASAALHAVARQSQRKQKTYHDTSPPRADAIDSEVIYFDLLKLIGEHLDLRVVIDIVAGASAGGVNGITLARALAHDLDITSVTDAWLNEGDVEFMMTDQVRANTWSKAVLTPFIHAFAKFKMADIAPDREMRGKISMFLRSRWFKPPFDGPIVSDMYFRAIDNMGDSRGRSLSLMPPAQQLHLYVTVTDFFGHQQHLRIHSPELVQENEHRHVLTFSYGRRSGILRSDFDHDSLPGLIFAARATSSYPGAFPPATISEIDALLRSKQRDWPKKDHFINRNFAPYLRQGADPAAASFIDGSVLNNKPFAAAIDAIKKQNAFREVDRRLVYIDPDPDESEADASPEIPGFLATLIGSLSSLPRSQPIRDDLAFVGGYNDRIRRVKLMMESARPRIDAAVRAIAEEAADEGAGSVRRARRAAHQSVMSEVGLFYDGYLDLKIGATLDDVVGLVASALGLAAESRERHSLANIFNAWAEARGITRRETAGPAARDENPAWLRFLDRFDLGFRDRRIRFVIRSLNLLYPRIENTISDVTASDLDNLKRQLYELLDSLQPFHDGSFVDAPTRAVMEELVARGLSCEAKDCFEAIDDIADRLHGQMSLNQSSIVVEDLLSRQQGAMANRALRHELIHAYVGYAYWDILTFSITNWRSVGEFDEIRVDRISPLDATGIRSGGKRAVLQSLELEGFAGFFSRKRRENDYLWGRLHGVERLIDIVCSAAPALNTTAGKAKVEALKTAAFNAIIKTERDRLTAIDEEFARLDEELAARNRQANSASR